MALVLGGLLPSKLSGQELEEGTWTGTLTDDRGRVAEVLFEVKRIPDPHARWRSGGGDILTATLLWQGQQARRNQPVLLSEARLEGELLSYRAASGRVNRILPDYDARCSLTRQEDGSFAGQCRGEADGEVAQITMTPPADVAR